MLDERGSVFVEYLVVLTLVVLGAVSALVAIGPLLLGLYRMQEAVLLAPIP
jgi:hypothetical protein